MINNTIAEAMGTAAVGTAVVVILTTADAMGIAAVVVCLTMHAIKDRSRLIAGNNQVDSLSQSTYFLCLIKLVFKSG